MGRSELAELLTGKLLENCGPKALTPLPRDIARLRLRARLRGLLEIALTLAEPRGVNSGTENYAETELDDAFFAPTNQCLH